MREQKKGITSKIFFLLVVMLCGYFIFKLIVCQVDIGKKRQELAAVQNSLTEQLAANNELNRELSGSDQEIIERAARDELGYARPNERIFVDVSGK